MKILAVDTATQSCGVAIIDNGALLIEITTGIKQTHSKHLLDLINTAMEMAGLAISGVDGFAVTVGPGSFTGLRIGISTVKGLAFANGKPVIGISSLDALAWQCAQGDGIICAMLDARRQEVYFCRYRFRHGELKKESTEQVASAREALRGICEPCVFVGNGAQIYHEIILAELAELGLFASPSQHTIRASSIAYLSVNRFDQHETDNIASLVPRYIRKSDAMLNARSQSSLKSNYQTHRKSRWNY
jgi:tRNA threonylcarbamoyladenosine biosynthesis protein TsaB